MKDYKETLNEIDSITQKIENITNIDPKWNKMIRYVNGSNISEVLDA